MRYLSWLSSTRQRSSTIDTRPGASYGLRCMTNPTSDIAGAITFTETRASWRWRRMAASRAVASRRSAASVPLAKPSGSRM